MVHYLEVNELILDSQHGFRKGRSCLSNLLTFLDKVTVSIDAGDNADVIFMDFAKAFDKVPPGASPGQKMWSERTWRVRTAN